jgi:L,D-transpeptidase YcbB
MLARTPDRNRLSQALSLLPLFAAALLASCKAPPPAEPFSPAEATRAALIDRVGPPGSESPVYCRSERLCGSEVLAPFYRARDFRPAWIDDGLALASAASYVEALRLVVNDGLDPRNYHLEAIDSLMAEIAPAQNPQARPVRTDDLVDLEMLLTDSFLLCGSHLVHGQVDPETIQSEWFIQGRVEDLTAALERGLADDDPAGALDSLRPAHAVYRGLTEALRRARLAVETGGWPAFPPGPKLRKGDREPRIEALRSCLLAMGDLVPQTASTPPPSSAHSGPSMPAYGIDPALFDAELEEAVKAFQRRHGLAPDGVAGEATASALAVPAAERLTQVLANLERWRWITQNLGDPYILINVADFRVGVVEGGREVLSMPAIVGTAYRRTPAFSGKMTYLEVNPAWHVPPRLAREDILPKVRKDPSYLADRGFRVFRDWSAGSPEIDPGSVDWMRIDPDSLSFKFRQDPGPRNSLGRIKFMFPNKFDVYLHDTPDRGLFTRAARDLSSGCIRIERPVDLAAYVLRGDPNWDREKILAALDDNATRVVNLRTPIAVHLLYWTAWMGDDGKTQFRGDIYLRDAALFEALREKASEPPL